MPFITVTLLSETWESSARTQGKTRLVIELLNEQKRGTGPSPVAAVSLGPGPRDSTGDVLAGWGWGTDKHDAIKEMAFYIYGVADKQRLKTRFLAPMGARPPPPRRAPVKAPSA